MISNWIPSRTTHILFTCKRSLSQKIRSRYIAMSKIGRLGRLKVGILNLQDPSALPLHLRCIHYQSPAQEKFPPLHSCPGSSSGKKSQYRSQIPSMTSWFVHNLVFHVEASRLVSPAPAPNERLFGFHRWVWSRDCFVCAGFTIWIRWSALSACSRWGFRLGLRVLGFALVYHTSILIPNFFFPAPFSQDISLYRI